METDVSIEEWAERLAEVASHQYANEAALRHGLYTVFYPFMTEFLSIDPRDIRHEESAASGWFDSLFAGILLEYKKPGELSTPGKRRLHATQAIAYLEDSVLGADIVILTDGGIWGILRDQPNPDIGEQGWLDLEFEPPAVPEDRFQWRDNSQTTARRVLDLLATVRTVPVSTASLVAHMGPASTGSAGLLAAFASTLQRRRKGSRADILFNQWVQLAGVSYGIADRNTPWPGEVDDILGPLSPSLLALSYAETIFLLHTYVAYCSKLIAAETLSLSLGLHQHRPSQWVSLSSSNLITSIENMESGQLARELRAPGLMGSDLFGWYAPLVATEPQLESAIRASLRSFAGLAWARLTHISHVTSDLLRDFYASVVPRKLRKGLGEFFTPQWIAERVVSKAISLIVGEAHRPLRILDPSCGSGTFLVAAFRRALLVAAARGLDSVAQAQEAIDSVYGIDINPVSPLMARVNLLLALGDAVEELGSVSFNVYQADSILIPEEHFGATELEDTGDLRVPLVIGTVLLPNALGNLQGIAAFTRVVDQSVRAGRDRATFERRLAAEFRSLGMADDELLAAVAPAGDLYERLVELHAAGKNGIWAHVIEQAFAPRAMPHIDLVVGNPPWISWKHLPEAWRARSEPVWSQWGLWQTKKSGQGTPMSDLSTLLLARSIATYCPEGLVAMLLPEGILLNEPGGRAIRRCRLEAGGIYTGAVQANVTHFDPVFVDDFSSLNPFSPDAANKPIALYLRSGNEATFPLDAVVWKRSLPRSSLRADDSWADATRTLSSTEVRLGPIDPKDIASRWRPADTDGQGLRPRSVRDTSWYVWGQGFHSRGADGIYYCQLTSRRPNRNGLVRVRTRPELGKNTKGLPSAEFEVEAEFVWPLVRGRDVGAFQIGSSGLYCLLPHVPEDLAKVMTRNQLISRAPHLYDYLEQHQDRLLHRSAYDLKLTDDTPWGIQGTSWRYLRPEVNLVVCRYIYPDKRPPAAVAPPTAHSELGRSTTIYPNNKLNFVACGSIQEADYLCAFVNSSRAQDLIARLASSTTISPGVMNSLPIPRYDRTNSLYCELARLGRVCREEPSSWVQHRSEITSVVDQIAGNSREA